MTEFLRSVYDHRQEIGATCMALLVGWTTVATALARCIKRPPPSSPWIARLLFDLFIDTPAWLAVLERSGILGGIFNLPGVPSRQPADNPTPAATKAMQLRGPSDAALVLAMALGVIGMFAGCGPRGAAFGNSMSACELGKLPSTLEAAIAEVTAILFSGGQTWQNDLEQLGVKVGASQLDCVVEAVSDSVRGRVRKGQVAEPYIEAERRSGVWLAQHGRKP